MRDVSHTLSGNSLTRRSFLEKLNLLEMGCTLLSGAFMMCQAPQLLKTSVFCSLVVDGEGDKGQRTITNG